MGEFGEFLQQIPLPLILNCFITASAFIALVAYFTYFKPRRQRNQQKASLAAFEAPLPHDEADLPDLDMLLTEHEPPTPAPVSVPTTAPVPKPAPKGQQMVMSILRDPTDNRLAVQIDGTVYRSLADHPEVKQRFMALMKELSEVVTKPDVRPVVEETPTPAPTPTPTPKFTPPPPATDGKMPGDLPNYREVTETPKRGLFGAPKYEAPPVPELNLAAAIEAYLQHKLKYTPEYAHRSIHIHNAPGGGVRIEVDGVFYEAVGDVADPEARAFIATAIQEWQDRQ